MNVSVTAKLNTAGVPFPAVRRLLSAFGNCCLCGHVEKSERVRTSSDLKSDERSWQNKESGFNAEKEMAAKRLLEVSD